MRLFDIESIKSYSDVTCDSPKFANDNEVVTINVNKKPRPPIDKSISKMIKSNRQLKKMSIDELANLTNISSTILQNYEMGIAPKNKHHIKKISKVLEFAV